MRCYSQAQHKQQLSERDKELMLVRQDTGVTTELHTHITAGSTITRQLAPEHLMHCFGGRRTSQ